jgi:hypothetical protein
MSKETATVQRLSLIKYLYTLGINQSYKSDPMGGLAILNFHDCVELFLQLSAEKVGVTRTRDRNFMEYWDLISGKGYQLSLKEAMSKLNDSRAGLKHGGVVPSRINIESFRVTTTEFLQESCKLIFNIEFREISLVDFIIFKNTKNHLRMAIENYGKSNVKETLINLAVAFEYSLREFEKYFKDKNAEFYGSPFYFGKSMDPHSSFWMGLGGGDRLSDFIDDTSNSIKNIQDALKILSLGIDYKKYLKFIHKMPFVRFTASGNPTADIRDDKAKLTESEFEFYKDFIIESALKLQEFDY